MRVFIAINLPADVRETLWDATADLREGGYPVRWVKPELLHLTVKFLGDVDRSRLPEIAGTLEAVATTHRPFALPFGGAGVFPNARRPRVIWIGCEPVPPLELLQHEVETHLARLGFPSEGRPFRPHLTIGRAKSPGGRWSNLESRLERIDARLSPIIESVDVMQSRLGPGGPRYETQYAIGLGT